MAKGKSSKKVVQVRTVLPQNILPIGEKVEEDKRIYILQRVYKEIHKFTKDKTSRESGGILIGTVVEEFGKTNILINGFVEAKYSEGTPTTLKFTHQTWEYVHKEMERKFPKQNIVGWIHTHPDFGIFLSEYDKFIQQNFFKEANQIAYVVDPIQDIEGFYFWINGKIEHCKGFYIFDKNGVKITVEHSSSDTDTPRVRAASSMSGFKSILLAILSVALIALLIINFSLIRRIENLERQQRTLSNTINSAFSVLLPSGSEDILNETGTQIVLPAQSSTTATVGTERETVPNEDATQPPEETASSETAAVNEDG